MDKYLTVVEVAEILKLTVSTVYKLIDHDNLDQTNSAKKLKPINPTTYRGEGGYRFSPEEIERIKPYYVKEKLTPAEASKKIGRSTTYIYKLLKKGLPYERAVYRGKETYLISPGDLEPYVNEKTNFGKYDTIFDKKTGVYLFQLYTLNNQIGRIISIKRVNHKRIESVLQVEGKQIPLEEALSKGWVPVTTIGERKIVTSYGYASFVFPIPMDMSSMIYETINILFELAGPLNLRVSVRGSSIYVDVKKMYLPVTHPEMITTLLRCLEEGEISKRANGIFISTGLSPITFYLNENKKTMLQELAKQQGLTLQVWLEDHFSQLLNEEEVENNGGANEL